MKNDAKFTILNWLDWLLSPIAPLFCKGCGRLGSPLCERCINDILHQPCPICLRCRKRLNSGNMCTQCRKSSAQRLTNAWVVGWRTGALRKLTNDYKFHSELNAAQILALLLQKTLQRAAPELSLGAIVYVPTIERHIRARGFDHMALVAQQLGARLGVPVLTEVLVRLDNHVQHGSNRQERQRIVDSLGVRSCAQPPRSVLLIDDIWTTGATMQTAAALLRRVGVLRVYGLIVAVQPESAELEAIKIKTLHMEWIIAWRKGRDSNPRRRCRLTAFRERPDQPLLHPSSPLILANRWVIVHN